MNKSTKKIIEELIQKGYITNERDLTANDKTNIIFDYMIKKYSYLLDEDINTVLSKSDFEKGKIIHQILLKFGKYFLSNSQIIEYDSKINSDEPVIYVTNHRFKDDILSTILAIKNRAFIVFGSLPQFYGTLDGIMSAKNGVVMVNRKNANSKRASVEKAKYVLKNNMNLLICPEGVWNKSPNECMLDFWSGFYRIAKKEDGTFYKIVPVVHYIYNTYESSKNNNIHTIVGDPISLDGFSEQEGVSYVRTVMLNYYWNLMEKYGVTKRDDLLKGFSNSTEAWEYELTNRVKTADKYDFEIEISADKKKKNNELDIWDTIANLDVTKENAIEVINAKKKVKELKTNDFQHRF